MASRSVAKGLFASEAQTVVVGIGGVCAAGISMAVCWFAWVADRKPKTMTPAWAKATATYRAAQNQDPITNGGSTNESAHY